MKVAELFEASDVWVIYKAQGTHSPFVYYGYNRGSSVEDAKASFFANRNDKIENRGTIALLKANNDDAESISFEVLDNAYSEVDARGTRNELRTEDPNSISIKNMFLSGARKEKERDIIPPDPAEVERSKEKYRIEREKEAERNKIHAQKLSQRGRMGYLYNIPAVTAYKEKLFNDEDMVHAFQTLRHWERAQFKDDAKRMSAYKFAKKYKIRIVQ